MRRQILLLISVSVIALSASAQSVPIKSVPVAEGDQFLLFPSERLAMGGVSIALDDRLLDPFVNPSKAVNVSGMRFVSSPTYYGFLGNGTAGDGSGRTLPVGALAHRDGFFGGAMMAYQELLAANPGGIAFNQTIGGSRQESSISQDNIYFFALAGGEIPGTGWAVGASLFKAQLRGLEGVRRMYNTTDVRQNGGLQQYRLGVYRRWDSGDAAEAVLMHHRFEMTHQFQEFSRWQNPPSQRLEEDQTRSFALQTGYKHVLESGWIVGGSIVGDWKWHPKIPNYDVMQIPRDPGDSFAYNFGVGLARTMGRATFGLDLIYEPIWSHTWADAAAETQAANGAVIPKGGKTVDNHFDFNNARIRMGIHQVGEYFDFAIGLDMHRISYELDQMDFVAALPRLLDQSWTEWTVSTGFGREFSGMRVQYMGRMTLGTGRPGVVAPWGGGIVRTGNEFASGDWIVAPSGPLGLQEAIGFSHQLTLIVPLVE